MFNKIAEDKIREAILAGEFDNLPGKGKPLILDNNPFESDDWRLANSLLRQNNFIYPWMEKAVEIETSIKELRLSGHELWSSIQSTAEKIQFVSEYSYKIKALNHKILDYNLQVPAPVFQKPVLDLDIEIKIITG
jgi:hypothetical protein